MFKKGKSSIIFIIIGIIIIVPTVFLFTNLGTLSDFFLELEQYKLSKTIEPIIETSSTTFITKWKTDNQGTSENNQIKLPLVSDGTYNFTIDWGDNTSDIITIYNQNEITHTYSNPGIYPIIIDGSITGFSFKTIYTDNKNMKIVKTDNEKLLEILQWGNLKLGNNEDYFRNCKYMTISASDILDLEGTTNLTRMFFGCKSIHKIPNIELWDISNITNLNSMFSSVTRFNQDISNWDVSNVTNMSYMFYRVSSFNQDISNWDTSKVTDISGMFTSAQSFNQDIGHWDVSNVKNMLATFQSANDFNQNIGHWDVSNVTNMNYLFSNTKSFNQNISNWDVSNVTDISGMFSNASNFNQNISNWDVSKIINYNMFDYGANDWLDEYKPTFQD